MKRADGVVVGIGLFFSAFMIFLTWVQGRYTAYKVSSAEEFTSASRSIKPSLLAAGIVSAWTWAATLLQSSAVAYDYGISGPWWYAAGATVQVCLSSLFRKSPSLRPSAGSPLRPKRCRLEAPRTRRSHLPRGRLLQMGRLYPHGPRLLCAGHQRHRVQHARPSFSPAPAVSSLSIHRQITGASATVAALTGMNTIAACGAGTCRTCSWADLRSRRCILIPVTVVIYVMVGGPFNDAISCHSKAH